MFDYLLIVKNNKIVFNIELEGLNLYISCCVLVF